MDADLRSFAVQWLRVATVALVPVILVAFACVPLALERHPGEPVAASERFQGHMT